MTLYLKAAIVAGLLFLTAILGGKIYYAGIESQKIKQERANHEASQKAREIERDSARCTPPCILPDPFRKD